MLKCWVIYFSYNDSSTAVHLNFPIHFLLQFKCIDVIYDKTEGKYLPPSVSYLGEQNLLLLQQMSLHNLTVMNFSKVIWSRDRIILQQVNNSRIKQESFFKWHCDFEAIFVLSVIFVICLYLSLITIISRASLVQSRE